MTSHTKKSNPNINAHQEIPDPWNILYELEPLKFTDWELIEPENLKHYIDYTFIEMNEIVSILEIGCGRGFRILSLILLDNEVNRIGVNIKCIDYSENAIKFANKMLKELQGGKFPEAFKVYCEVYGGIISKDLKDLINENKVPSIKCNIEFIKQDVFEGFENEVFDLVIDWMCFHEIAVAQRDEYAQILSKVSGKLYILTVFYKDDKECSEIKYPEDELKKIGGNITKHRFTIEQLTEIFKEFHHIDFQNKIHHPMNVYAHSDGKEFPKITILMSNLVK